VTESARDAIPRWLRIASELAWRSLLVAAAIVVLGLLVARLRIVFLPMIVALLFATLLVPPVTWLQRRGVPRAIGSALVMAVSLALVVGVVGGLTPQVAGELEKVDVNVGAGLDEVADWLVEGPLGLEREDVREYRSRIQNELSQRGGSLATGALGGALLLVEIVLGALLALVLLFFFVKDGRRMWAWFVTRFPERLRGDVHAVGEIGWAALGGYLRGTTLVALVDAVGIGVALVLLGVPLALPLALLTFVAGFFPIVGAVSAGFVAAMVALATEGLTTALLVVGATILVQQLEGNLLQPLIVGRAVQLHPAAIIVAVAAGGVLWGVAGAFIAVPLAAVVSQGVGFLRARPRPAATLSP
jgi:predicted PurR-regulated permease PerM